jgi:serine/threonine protein kinase/WD40 repeat protein
MTNRLMRSEWDASEFASLEEAVAQCLRVAEKDPHVDLEKLASQFPRWREELREFFADWEHMERLSSRVGGRRRELRTRALLGSKVRYFGDYELLEEIGHGGMGIIFKARQISLDRIVALKMILDPRHDSERFRVEAEAAASLDHPNIVSIHEVGQFEGHPYFSMQYVDGGSLSDRIADAPLPTRLAAELTSTIARAVHFAHQRGILHRDLKPANVLIDSRGRPYISDFGLAKQIQADADITRSGAILGTPGYMAPEQAIGEVKNLTVATDVYGLGAVLYAALAGQPPFCGRSSLETLRLVIERPPRLLRPQRSGISRDLETICLKCLEKSPQLRYASAEALADDIDRYLRDEPIEARPIGRIARLARWCRREPAIASLSALVMVLLVTSAVVSSILAHKHKQASDVANVTLADYYTSQGLLAADHEDPHHAALWYAAAAELAQDDPQRVRQNLIHLDGARQQVAEPIAVLWVDAPAVSRIQFSPDSTRLLCEAGPESVLWSFMNDDRWRLADALPHVRCASLSDRGDLLAMGAHDGRVAIVDINSRRTLRELEFARPIQQLVFSQDGEILAVAEGKSVHLYRCRQKEIEVVGMPLAHPRKVLRVVLDRQAQRVMTVCRSETQHEARVRLFRIGSAEPEFAPLACVIEGDTERRTAFWPTFIEQDSQLLVKHQIRDGSSYFRAYDVASGEPRATYPLGKSNALVMSPDGHTFLNCGHRYARVVGFQRGRVVRQKERLVHRERVVVADFSSDGRLAATAGWDRDLRIWFVGETSPQGIADNDARPALAVLGHQTRVKHVTFAPNDQLLATVQLDGLVRVSRIPELSGAEPKFRVAGATRLMLIPPQAAAALLPPPNRSSREDAASVDWLLAMKGASLQNAMSSEVTVRRLVDRRQFGPAISVDGILIDADFSPTGLQLATINSPLERSRATMFAQDGSAGTLCFWSWPGGHRQFDPIAMPAEPRTVAYRPDGKQLAVMTALGQVLLIDTQTGVVTNTLATSSDKLSINFPSAHGIVRYSPDGRSLIAWARQVWVWNVATGQLRFPPIENENRRGMEVEVSSDGKQMAIAGGRYLSVRVIELETGRLLGRPIKHADMVFTASFSPDGRLLVTACRDGQARVFDWATGELVLRGLSHDCDVLNAVFTPDGKYILTVGLDGTLRTWNAHDGRLAMRPHRVRFRDRQILVTPDSRYAATTGAVGEVHVVDLRPLYGKPKSSLAQAKLLGELLSNQTIHDGGTVKLTTSEWLERWRNFASPARR